MSSPSSGPLDEEVLRRIQAELEKQDQYERVEFEPSSANFRNIAAHYDPALYPETVSNARVDIRWHVGGDYSFHYIECWQDGTQWECRWDRHPEDIGRTHFHSPPDAGTPEPANHPIDYRDMLALVRTYINERIETTWQEFES